MRAPEAPIEGLPSISDRSDSGARERAGRHRNELRHSPEGTHRTHITKTVRQLLATHFQSFLVFTPNNSAFIDLVFGSAEQAISFDNFRQRRIGSRVFVRIVA
jgi:hypothetical protein